MSDHLISQRRRIINNWPVQSTGAEIMRVLCMAGESFTEAEKSAILNYCAGDAVHDELLCNPTVFDAVTTRVTREEG